MHMKREAIVAHLKEQLRNGVETGLPFTTTPHCAINACLVFEKLIKP